MVHEIEKGPVELCELHAPFGLKLAIRTTIRFEYLAAYFGVLFFIGYLIRIINCGLPIHVMLF
jgi:hypothetical protein